MAFLSHSDMAHFLESASLGKLKHYKFLSKGLDTTTFSLSTPFQKYVLTLFDGPRENFDMLSLLEVTHSFTQKGVPIPKILFSGKLGEQDALVTTFTEGKVRPKWSAADYHQIGFLLGNWHRISLESELFFPSPPASIDVMHTLLSIQDKIPKEFASVLEELQMIESKWPSSLPKGVIHGDLWYKSFLFHKDVPSAILDFTKPLFDLYVLDLASLMKGIFFSSQEEDPAPFVDALLDGYEIGRPLSGEELAALPLMILFKIISTLVYLLKQSISHPEKHEEFQTTALLNLFKYQKAKGLLHGYSHA